MRSDSPWSIDHLRSDFAYEMAHWDSVATTWATSFEHYNGMLRDLFDAEPLSRISGYGGEIADNLLRAQLRRLPVRQRVVVESFYGVWTAIPLKLSTIAAALDITIHDAEADLQDGKSALRADRDKWLLGLAAVIPREKRPY